MKNSANAKATFAEVFGTMKFGGKSEIAPAHPWPTRRFAVMKSSHAGQAALEEAKLVRSSN